MRVISKLIVTVSAALFIALQIALGVFTVNAADDNHGSADDGSFNAGKFVIDHVSDAYEWHITSFGDIHVSVPFLLSCIARLKG
jgi:F-type H+-transporting ATPase subunit a